MGAKADRKSLEVAPKLKAFADDKGFDRPSNRLVHALNREGLQQGIIPPRSSRWTLAILRRIWKHLVELNSAIPSAVEVKAEESRPTETEVQPRPLEDSSVIHAEPHVIPRKEDDVIPAASHVIPPKDEGVLPKDATVIPFEPREVSELRMMLRWWQERGGETAGLPLPLQERPRFDRSDAARATIRLGGALFKDASRWAKKHRAETGGNFSGLVEVLLWERLGRDPKYLRQTKEEGLGASGEEGSS